MTTPSSNSWAWIDESGGRDRFDGAAEPGLGIGAAIFCFLFCFFLGGAPGEVVRFLSHPPFFFFFLFSPFFSLTLFFPPPRVSFLPFLFFSCPSGLSAAKPRAWAEPLRLARRRAEFRLC